MADLAWSTGPHPCHTHHHLDEPEVSAQVCDALLFEIRGLYLMRKDISDALKEEQVAVGFGRNRAHQAREVDFG